MKRRNDHCQHFTPVAGLYKNILKNPFEYKYVPLLSSASLFSVLLSPGEIIHPGRGTSGWRSSTSFLVSGAHLLKPSAGHLKCKINIFKVERDSVRCSGGSGARRLHTKCTRSSPWQQGRKRCTE